MEVKMWTGIIIVYVALTSGYEYDNVNLELAWSSLSRSWAPTIDKTSYLSVYNLVKKPLPPVHFSDKWWSHIINHRSPCLSSYVQSKSLTHLSNAMDSTYKLSRSIKNLLRNNTSTSSFMGDLNNHVHDLVNQIIDRVSGLRYRLDQSQINPDMTDFLNYNWDCARVEFIEGQYLNYINLSDEDYTAALAEPSATPQTLRKKRSIRKPKRGSSSTIQLGGYTLDMSAIPNGSSLFTGPSFHHIGNLHIRSFRGMNSDSREDVQHQPQGDSASPINAFATMDYVDNAIRTLWSHHAEDIESRLHQIDRQLDSIMSYKTLNETVMIIVKDYIEGVNRLSGQAMRRFQSREELPLNSPPLRPNFNSTVGYNYRPPSVLTSKQLKPPVLVNLYPNTNGVQNIPSNFFPFYLLLANILSRLLLDNSI